MERTRWRKALATALVFHSFLLCGLGFMSPQIPLSPEPETYIELELASSPAGGFNEAAADENASAAPMAHKVNNEFTPQKTTTQSAPVAAVNAAAMSMVAAETGGDNGGADAATEAKGSGGSGTQTSGNGSGSSTSGKGGGVSPPGILSRIDPNYPEAARNAGQEGTVVVKIRISENGIPSNVSVIRSSGFSSLDGAAVTAVGKWRFVPAKRLDNGQAIVCHTTLPVVFRLH